MSLKNYKMSRRFQPQGNPSELTQPPKNLSLICLEAPPVHLCSKAENILHGRKEGGEGWHDLCAPWGFSLGRWQPGWAIKVREKDGTKKEGEGENQAPFPPVSWQRELWRERWHNEKLRGKGKSFFLFQHFSPLFRGEEAGLTERGGGKIKGVFWQLGGRPTSIEEGGEWIDRKREEGKEEEEEEGRKARAE